MTQKLPISNYKFVSKFNKLSYGQNKNYSCLLNVEIYTTKKVLNNKILSQFPGLISKTKISYDQLSDFQRKNLKENYKSSEKIISHLGYDKNSYISFEMYEMMKSLGYKIIQIQIQILGQSRRLVGPRPILALPIYHSFVPGLTVACSEG